MSVTVEHILNEAMNLRPSERAVIAQQLIHSLSIDEDEIEQEWLNLAHKRLSDIKSNNVMPVTWAEIKEKIKNRR